MVKLTSFTNEVKVQGKAQGAKRKGITEMKRLMQELGHKPNLMLCSCMRDLHCGALDSIKLDATFRESGFICLLKSTQRKQKTRSQREGNDCAL